MIERELLIDLRAEIRKIAREEVKKAIEEQIEPKRDESGSISCVDAATVKRGRWIRDEFGSRCERCGLYAYREKSERPWESDYCPYCGADMRGEQP